MIIKYIVVIAFLITGLAQIFQAKPIVEQFKEFGLPIWMASAVGLLQIAGAIGLLFAPTSFSAALGLALLMLGAVANHVKAGQPAAMSAPAFLLLVLTSYLTYSLS